MRLNVDGRAPAIAAGWMLALYLGMAPIYWIPGVAPRFLLGVKTFLFVGATGVALITALRSRKFYFPGGGKLLLALLIFLTLTLLASVGADTKISLYRVQNSIQIIAFLFTCRFALSSREVLSILRPAVRIFLVFSLISLLTIIVAPDLVNPFNPQLTVADSGFGGLRTGWSPANALFLSWMGVTTILPGGPIIVGLAVATLVGNQVLVGGRAGLLATVVIFFSGLLARRRFLSIALAVATMMIAFFLARRFSSALRLGDIGSGGAGFDAVNNASSGRVEQYALALELIAQKPLGGLGFGSQLHGGLGSWIHNDFLKLAVEGGAAYGLLGLAIVTWGLIRGWRMSRTDRGVARAAFLTLVGGFVVAQFEPGFLFGNFNTSCFWWFSFCVCFSRASQTARTHQ